MEAVPTTYAESVASSLSSMGSFHMHDIWAHSASTCHLTAELREKTETAGETMSSPDTAKTSVRLAPLVAAIIICIWLCSWPAYRQLDRENEGFGSYPERVAKMAECQYGCTGSVQYETCVVGCVEIMSEKECQAAILCDDCPLAFPEPHSFAQQCKQRCSKQ